MRAARGAIVAGDVVTGGRATSGAQNGAIGAEIGRAIREIREAQGLDQFTLSERVGITQGDISRYERNLREPRLGMLRRIAEDGLGVPVETFLVRAGYLRQDDEAYRQQVEQAVVDLVEALASVRPRLARDLRRLKQEETAEGYRDALLVIARHLSSSVDFVLDARRRPPRP